MFHKSGNPAGASPLSDQYPPNDPIGEAQGIFPGRVVWIWNPDATNENCTLSYNGDGVADEQDDGWFLDKNNDQDVIDQMLSSGLRNLTEESSDAAAWDKIFKYFNLKKHGLEDTGYTPGEKIFIKINATSTWGVGLPGGNITEDYDKRENDFYCIAETSPHVVLSVLRQLINTCGIAQEDISVGDPMKLLYNHCYDKWYTEFPNVNYIAHEEGYGRQAAVPGAEPVIFYSDTGSVLDVTDDRIYTVLEEADYMINIPALKAHSRAGITLFGKNHFGSQTRVNAQHLHPGLVVPGGGEPYRTDMGMYRVQVDLMGHDQLSRNTMLFLLDALWAGSEAVDPPTKWTMQPFNDDWTSSLFVSQDVVAIESVAFDFLRTEYNGEDGKVDYPNMGGVDDYLHQAADSTLWPEGIIYDPEGDGTPIPSLGVHEHWNNQVDKEYSRNLNTGDGIELIFLPLADITPPHIEILYPEEFENIALENIPVQVGVMITDSIAGVLPDSVFLVYKVEDDSVETRVPMINSEPDMYTAEVASQEYDTDVFFRIEAYDSQFNKARSPWSTFEVTDAVTLSYDDGIPRWFHQPPEAGSGYANKFIVHGDSVCIIHKVMFYLGRENGLFDVVINSGSTLPELELARYDGITNGRHAGTFFQFEIPDTVSVAGPEAFWVGMRNVSPDTLLDPKLMIDQTSEYSEVSYDYFGGNWTELTDGEAMIRAKVKFYERPSDIDDGEIADDILPRAFALFQNYPNPFNPLTIISYDVPEGQDNGIEVKIDIYNLHGQWITTLVNGKKQPGSYTVQWNGRNDSGIEVGSGVYFYRIIAGDFTSARKMVIVK